MPFEKNEIVIFLKNTQNCFAYISATKYHSGNPHVVGGRDWNPTFSLTITPPYVRLRSTCIPIDNFEMYVYVQHKVLNSCEKIIFHNET